MNATEIDTEFLEDLFEDEIKCESPHTQTRCSGDVTYIVTCCKGEDKVCKNTVDTAGVGTRARMISAGYLCAHCKNLAIECWTIRPI